MQSHKIIITVRILLYPISFLNQNRSNSKANLENFLAALRVLFRQIHRLIKDLLSDAVRTFDLDFATKTFVLPDTRMCCECRTKHSYVKCIRYRMRHAKVKLIKNKNNNNKRKKNETVERRWWSWRSKQTRGYCVPPAATAVVSLQNGSHGWISFGWEHGSEPWIFMSFSIGFARNLLLVVSNSLLLMLRFAF